MAGVKFRHEGLAVDYTPGAAVSAGDVIVQGDLVGVARLDIPANQLGALAVSGVFEFPKATGGSEALAAGTTVYWDAGDDVVTDDDDTGSNALVGKVVRAAADGDATVWVRLSQ
ncbi:MAG: DUF2190 family protein [Phycisphaerales bacterium]|nr:MAG: DUF2190 family protein [Phycisphaerales bacterium]